MIGHLLLVAAAAAAAATAVPAPGLAELGWLKGAWVSENSAGWTEEHWTADRGGMMLGLNRSGKGAKATGFEFMRIQRDERGRILFWASPGGKTPVSFLRTGGGPREAVFENPANDYPTRIVYRREGNLLRATISGPEGKNPISWTFRRPKRP